MKELKINDAEILHNSEVSSKQLVTVKNELSEEEQIKIYQQFLEEIEKLEKAGNLDDENIKAGEDLLKRLSEAYQQGQLSEEGFTELYDRLDQFLHGDYNSIAEAAEGSNSILLKDSGWFQEYSSYAMAEESSADKSDAGITIAKTKKASARSGTLSDPKTVDFPIPSVHGYLSELSFTKVRANNQPLEGAQFTLHHDTETCSICRGDGKSSVAIPDLTATSGADGTVLFQNIPSGHEYQLTETVVPEGYMAGHETYHVKVAYDTLTVTVTAADGTVKEWNGQIMNHSYYKLPETGGTGTLPFILSGLALIAGALVYDRYRRRSA